MNRLFVGNLPLSTTETDLRKHLAPAGKVSWVRMPAAHDGRSRGFAFVGMRSNIDAQIAIFRFDGSQLQDRLLTVAFAKPRPESDS